jgi:hypothetical protein
MAATVADNFPCYPVTGSGVGVSVLLASTPRICRLVAACFVFLHIVQGVAAVHQVLLWACLDRQAGWDVTAV